MSVVQIDSPQNPRIKSAARLRTRRGRTQQGQIIIDGEREVRRAIECGVELRSIFVPATIDAGQWEQCVCDVFSVAANVFSKIAFGERNEVVAVADPPERSLQQLGLSAKAKIAVLEGIEKPGNLGAILRSADAAGIEAVVLVDPVVEVFNPNTIRASLGTAFSMPVATVDFETYVVWARELSIMHWLAKCDEGAGDYRDADFDQRGAIVLGSEARGLTKKWGNLGSAGSLFLPMRGIADSLNVSVAAAVLFYEATRSR